MRNKKGFTLIELLIVVAIIAILAAIAVPNFLEAQVRAKVSRVKNDQRNLATGLESYYIDYSTYIPNNAGVGGGDPLDSANVTSLVTLTVLSTPVSYVTSALIEDPFGTQYSLLSNNRATIGYINSSEDDYLANVTITTLTPALNPGFSAAQQRSLFDQGFFLTSDGPDRSSRVSEIAIINGGDPANANASDFADLLAEIANNPAIYDPSNGTISGGDILRTRKGIFTPFLVGIEGL